MSVGHDHLIWSALRFPSACHVCFEMQFNHSLLMVSKTWSRFMFSFRGRISSHRASVRHHRASLQRLIQTYIEGLKYLVTAMNDKCLCHNMVKQFILQPNSCGISISCVLISFFWVICCSTSFADWRSPNDQKHWTDYSTVVWDISIHQVYPTNWELSACGVWINYEGCLKLGFPVKIKWDLVKLG